MPRLRLLARLRSLLYDSSTGGYRAPPDGPVDTGGAAAAGGRAAAGVVARAGEHGAVAGYAGLLVVFTAEVVEPYSPKISARMSVLMPLQGLLLLGLSSRRDPIARLFGAGLLPALGELSYVQYVLQFIAADAWPAFQVTFPFFPFLAAVSFVGTALVHKPCQKLWLRHRALAVGAPAALAAALAVMASAYSPGEGQRLSKPLFHWGFGCFPRSNRSPRPRWRRGGALPAVINLGEGMVDVRLGIACRACAAGTVLINPSLAVVGGGARVAIA